MGDGAALRRFRSARGGSVPHGHRRRRTATPTDGEGPVREVQLRPFWIDADAVTNAQFAAFVEATGHVTEAERFGWSFVFAGLLPDDFPPTRARRAAPWWRQVDGARLARIPRARTRTSTTARDHPGRARLVERRAARTARGRARACRPRRSGSTRRAAGSPGARFPWGDELEPGGEHRMNVWQGTFPAAEHAGRRLRRHRAGRRRSRPTASACTT